MDDFGNIIYILAAIGWFFWNAYRKMQGGDKKESKSRKGMAGSRTDEAESIEPAKSFEELILEQVGGERKRQQPVLIESNGKHRNQDKFLSLDLRHSHLPDDYRMSISESGSHRVKRQVERIKEIEEVRDHNLLDELFPQEGFDLRKAVVLNAILERPYR